MGLTMINIQLQTLHEFLPAQGKEVQIFVRAGLGDAVELKSYKVEFAFQMRDGWDNGWLPTSTCYQNDEWENSLPMRTPLKYVKDKNRWEVMSPDERAALKELPYERQDECFYYEKVWYFTGGGMNHIDMSDQDNDIVGIIDSRILDAQLVASYDDGQHRKLHGGSLL